MNNWRFQFGCATLLTLLGFVEADSQQACKLHEFDLKNGIHVIVHEVPEAEDVGVETLYAVGFIDEPKGMVQSSHLLEHLVCYSPGAGFKTKAAMEWLNKNGMANAETLPDWTHYDYMSSAEHLEKILEIEGGSASTQFFFARDHSRGSEKGLCGNRYG